MEWHPVTNPADVDAVKSASAERPQAILKHSTRCSISSMTKARLERRYSEAADAINWHLLLVVEDREASNHAADVFDVYHQSPQLMLITDGECIFEETHGEISMEDTLSALAEHQSA